METVNSHGRRVTHVSAHFDINPEDLGPQVSYSAGGDSYPSEPQNPRMQSFHIITNTVVRFEASVKPAVPVVEYFWDFGDGTTGYGPEISHTYITASPETKITLTVTLVDGRKVRTHQAANLMPGSVILASTNSTSATQSYTESVSEISRNLVPNPRGLTTLTSRYSGLASTITQIPGGGIRATTTAATLAGLYFASGTTSGSLDIPVVVGEHYGVSVRLSAVPQGTTVTPQIIFRNSSGTNIAGSTTNLPSLTAPGTVSGLSQAAPAGAVTFAITFYRAGGGSAAVGDVIDLDAWTVTRHQIPPFIFTGDSYPNQYDYPYRTVWAGTPNASPSILNEVTRTDLAPGSITTDSGVRSDSGYLLTS